MSTFYAYYPSSSGAANPSVGTNGSTAPTSATEVAGVNPSGNLQPLKTDAAGNLLVDLASPMVVSDNVAQFGGNAVVTGTGASGLGIPRVTVSNDSSVLVSNFPATQPVSGTVTVTQATGTNLHSVIDSGTLTSVGSITNALPAGTNALGSVTVSNFPATQPVSGTVTANAGTGTFAVSAASLPLPTGASTSANQTTAISSLASIVTNTSNIPPLGQALAASSVPVVLTASQLTTLTPLSTVTVTQVTAANLNATVSIASAQTLANVTTLGTITNALPAGTNTLGSLNNISGTISLPTGAATSANQTTANTSLATIATNTTGVSTSALQTQISGQLPTTLGQKTKAASLAVTLASDQGSLAVSSGGTAIANAPVQNVYSTTNVTTTAYVQLIASTTAATNKVDIFDSSGQAMIFAVGASGSEVIQYYVPPGGDTFGLAIPAGSRIAIKALTANATSGYLLLNLLQ